MVGMVGMVIDIDTRTGSDDYDYDNTIFTTKQQQSHGFRHQCTH
jgi:hypothetical protein